MSKGVNALEIVFAMFILIVVTLVVIRLFTGIVKKDTLPNLDDFTQAYHYDQEVNKCSDLCSKYTSGGCIDSQAAYAYCQHKIAIDIDGNNLVGEIGHWGVVTSIPYCEDGLYCFHIKLDCGCGGYVLTDQTCLQIMTEYLQKRGLSLKEAQQTVCDVINPGTCPKDPTTWKNVGSIPGYKPHPILEGPYKGQIRGADAWWLTAGYGAICGQSGGEGGGQLSLTCQANVDKITCSWLGCTVSANSQIYIKQGSSIMSGPFPVTDASNPSYPFAISLSSGTYFVNLDCDNGNQIQTVNIP